MPSDPFFVCRTGRTRELLQRNVSANFRTWEKYARDISNAIWSKRLTIGALAAVCFSYQSRLDLEFDGVSFLRLELDLPQSCLPAL
jgi:hypothetical protein